MVKGNIEGLGSIREGLLDMLEQHGGLTHTPCPFDADKALIPFYL